MVLESFVLLFQVQCLYPIRGVHGNLRKTKLINALIPQERDAQNLKALGLWVTSLIKCSTSILPTNVIRFTHTYISQHLFSSMSHYKKIVF
jgi:hypothetical protein